MVHNNFFKHLSGPYIETPLELLNQSLREGQLPLSWKHGLLIPIHKTGKKATDCASFRPITLLPCMFQLMEKIICNRIYWSMEHHHKLGADQSGFRRRLSTIDQVARVESIIRNAISQEKIILASFLDLKGAYDSVSHSLLILKLARLGLKRQMLQWCKDFLKDWSFSVSYGGEQSTQRPITRGVPQGSCLSPLLFNVFIHDLHLPRTEDTIQTEFADDIALLVVGDKIQECTQRMQLALTDMSTYCALNDLTQYRQDENHDVHQKTYNSSPSVSRGRPPGLC